MAKKKILHISQATGGVKTYVAHILNYVDSNSYEFVVIAPADVIFEKFCKDRSIRYYQLDLERGNNPLKNVRILSKLITIIKKEKPDIVHAHSAKGGFLGRVASRFTGSKIIYTPHAFSYLPFTGVNRTIFYLLELMARKWTTSLLAISHSEANRAIYELGYKKNQVKVILNSIPVNGTPINLQSDHALKIRMVGRLTSQKNHMLFLEIADILLKKYPDLEFAVLGAGIHDDLAAEIDSFIANNKLENNVHIIHWGDTEISKKFLEETDIFIMTSVFEGLPFSLLEAMSLGKPCVVSKVDGNTDVINNSENGFACLSVEEFCEKIELLINDPALRVKLGMAGYEYVKSKHSIEKNALQLEKIYASI